MKKNIINIILTAIIISCDTGVTRSPDIDTTLVVPGKSCEGFTLGESVKVNAYTSSINSSLEKTPLSEVLDRNLPELKFNRIAYMRNSHVLFLHEGKVSAVAGLSAINRVTDEAVKLSDGADSFILSYGNRGLEIIRNGSNRIYLYRNLGIALFDDYGDDTIDMYMIFTPEKEIPAE